MPINSFYFFIPHNLIHYLQAKQVDHLGNELIISIGIWKFNLISESCNLAKYFRRREWMGDFFFFLVWHLNCFTNPDCALPSWNDPSWWLNNSSLWNKKSFSIHIMESSPTVCAISKTEGFWGILYHKLKKTNLSCLLKSRTFRISVYLAWLSLSVTF